MDTEAMTARRAWASVSPVPRPKMAKVLTPSREPVCRFDAIEHQYFIDGEEVPHITGMLDNVNLIDDAWLTEEGRERGQIVHRLAADFDLGAIADPRQVENIYKGWFLAHVAAMRTIRPTWTAVEQAIISVAHRFGGRPDRVGRVWGAWAVVDLKTGTRSAATPIQTALQAILAAPGLRLPPTAIVRYELDLKKNGKWELFEHTDRRNFDKAYEVIRDCAKAA